MFKNTLLAGGSIAALFLLAACDREPATNAERIEDRPLVEAAPAADNDTLPRGAPDRLDRNESARPGQGEARGGTPGGEAALSGEGPVNPNLPGRLDADGRMVSAEDALATNPSSAVGFVTRAAVSDLFEVEASRLAVARAKDERVRAFAQDMIAAHTQTSAELKTAVDKLEKSIIVPTELDSAHAAMLDVLRNVSEDAFDALYLDQQVQVHGQAQELMRGYIANGDTETLRAFAERTKPAIDAHASRARALAGGNAAADAPPRAQGGAAIPGDAERSGAR